MEKAKRFEVSSNRELLQLAQDTYWLVGVIEILLALIMVNSEKLQVRTLPEHR